MIRTDFLETARKAVLTAGRMIAGSTARPHDISRKSGFDFVTEVDRQSEEIIRTLIHDAFPDHGFFGEEEVSSGGKPEDMLLDEMPEYFWAVDALDGTTNFIRGIPNEKQQKMLRLKYIKGLSFPDIRRIMDLGKTNTYKLYKKAIDAASKIYSA